jgi:hypothetical protein
MELAVAKLKNKLQISFISAPTLNAFKNRQDLQKK